MKNIHVLSTDKPSRLWMDSDNNLNLHLIPTTLFKMQNISITSDDSPKEGEWYIKSNTNLPTKRVHLGNNLYKEDKKIILTTDDQLIKDGVQAIDDEFLKWFVKNPSCEEVEVESNKCLVKRGQCSCSYQDIDCQCSGYKIIIPKEEICSFCDGTGQVVSSTTISRFKTCDCKMLPKEEPKQGALNHFLSTSNVIVKDPQKWDFGKQETLEEVAKRLYEYQSQNPPYTIITPKAKIEGFIEGAKWQQERSYSEEEIIQLLNFVSKEYNISNGIGWFHTHESIEDISSKEVLDKWFEQFKKK
jgi:hypothetical protein